MSLAKIKMEDASNCVKMKGLYQSDQNFCGGTYEDIFSKKTIKTVKSRIKPNANAMILQRRRTRSEYDGDLNLDNKWDFRPYDTAQKKPTHKKIIKLNVSFSFSCSVSAEDLDKHCDLIKGVIVDLEKNGYLIQLNIFSENTGATTCKKTRSCFFEIKKPNQYLNHQDLASVFTTNFYRRVFFTAFIKSVEDLGLVNSGGLGTPVKAEKALEIKKDEIIFNSMVENKTQEEVLKEIYEKIS